MEQSIRNPAEAPLRPETFREISNLTLEDYVEMGDKLMQAEVMNRVTVKNTLQHLKFRRMAYYHVFGAPEPMVHPTMSMF